MKKPIVMKAVSYAKLQRRYGGKFIAREDGRVLASGPTYRQLLQAIRKRHLKREHLIVGYVPPKDAICIYPTTSFPPSRLRRSAIPRWMADTHRRRVS